MDCCSLLYFKFKISYKRSQKRVKLNKLK
jgi:uncharacterized membrane protein YciS (DUF1049 family)